MPNGSAAAGPPAHVPHVEILRLLPMVGVVATHTLMFTQPVLSIGANAALLFLHVNREVFFFVSAFVLVHSSGAARRPVAALAFWRRRYPLVVVAYLVWTLVYWDQNASWAPWPPGPALRELGVDLTTGWFHLYFLLVTMQLYLLLPALGWLVRRTRGRHRLLLAVSLGLQLAFTGVMQYAWGWIPGWLLPWFLNAQTFATSYQLPFVLGALAAAHLDEVLGWLRAHRTASLAGAAAAAAGAVGVYLLSLRLGQPATQAADVFQPSMVLVLGAALVALFWTGETMTARLPANGRAWRAARVGSRASFGVYLGHMLPLQLLLLTPLASLTGVSLLPAPARAAAVLAIVLATTFAGVLLLQRTPLGVPLTGRRRPAARARETAPLATQVGEATA